MTWPEVLDVSIFLAASRLTYDQTRFRQLSCEACQGKLTRSGPQHCGGFRNQCENRIPQMEKFERMSQGNVSAEYRCFSGHFPVCVLTSE